MWAAGVSGAKKKVFENGHQSELSFWKRRLVVFLWTDENGAFRIQRYHVYSTYSVRDAIVHYFHRFSVNASVNILMNVTEQLALTNVKWGYPWC